jgi:hypothetical protein
MKSLLSPLPLGPVCELGFRTLTVLRTKLENRLNNEPDMHAYITFRLPSELGRKDERQAYPSHYMNKKFYLIIIFVLLRY